MADRKGRFIIMSHFVKRYRQVTARDIVMNKYQAQWAADALLESYDMDTVKALIDRYLELSSSPSWNGFSRDAQKVYDGVVAETKDIEHRKGLRLKMKEWLDD